MDELAFQYIVYHIAP